MLGDQVGGSVEVARGGAMVDRLVHGAGLQIPAGRAAMQLRQLARRAQGQLVLEELAEEVVVAIPLAAAVQGHQEEVRPLELGQGAPRVGRARHRVAQGPREPPQDRGAQQEQPALRGLVVEHLGGEVVHHQPVVAREGVDERRRVRPVAHRQACEIEAGGPALGAQTQGGHLGILEGVSHHAAEEGGGLVVVEAQVGRAQLGQLAARPQPGDADRRLRAGGHHQVQALGQVRHHELQRTVHRRV